MVLLVGPVGGGPVAKQGHVPVVADSGVVMGQNCRWEPLNFTEGDGFPAQRAKRDARRFNTRAKGDEVHVFSPSLALAAVIAACAEGG